MAATSGLVRAGVVQQEPIACIPQMPTSSSSTVHRVAASAQLSTLSVGRSVVTAVPRVQLPLASTQVSMASVVSKSSVPSRVPGVYDAAPDWKQETLDAHNKYRARHGAEPLEWDDECEQLAQMQANECAGANSLYHGNTEGRDGSQGQNAFMAQPARGARAAVKSWYSEVKDYDFNAGGFSGNTGHFTQVVWKGTKKVGMAKSPDGVYVVANYKPAGNMMGDYERNVRPGNAPPSEASSAGGGASGWGGYGGGKSAACSGFSASGFGDNGWQSWEASDPNECGGYGSFSFGYGSGW